MLSEGGDLDRAGTEYFSGPVEHMSVPRAQDAVIAHFDESVRQHVLKKPTHTLFGRAGRACDLISGRFLVLKRDVAILQREEALMADGHSNDIRGKISEGVFATADWLTVHHPVLFPYVLIDVREQVGFFQLVSERGAEDD
jgi:hypothetical protein